MNNIWDVIRANKAQAIITIIFLIGTGVYFGYINKLIDVSVGAIVKFIENNYASIFKLGLIIVAIKFISSKK